MQSSSSNPSVYKLITNTSGSWLRLPHDIFARAVDEANLWSEFGEGRDDSRIGTSFVYVDSIHLSHINNASVMHNSVIEEMMPEKAATLLTITNMQHFHPGYLGVTARVGEEVMIRRGLAQELPDVAGQIARVIDVKGAANDKWIVLSVPSISTGESHRLLLAVVDWYNKIEPRIFDRETKTPEIQKLLDGGAHTPYEIPLLSVIA